MTAVSVAPTQPLTAHRVRLAALGFGLCGGPLAWIIQLNVNYALVSHACFPAVAPRVWPLSGWEAFEHRHAGDQCRRSRDRFGSSGRVLVGMACDTGRASRRLGACVGEGRSHFLAACGLMAAAGFFVATVFNTATLIWVPQCTG